jgi:hypothetical protein
MVVPRFSRVARSYLLHIGNLDWTKINPDIFGSMIQAVAEDEERGALGMHYTSMPTAIIIWIALAALAFLLLPSRGRVRVQTHGKRKNAFGRFNSRSRWSFEVRQTRR